MKKEKVKAARSPMLLLIWVLVLAGAVVWIVVSTLLGPKEPQPVETEAPAAVTTDPETTAPTVTEAPEAALPLDLGNGLSVKYAGGYSGVYMEDGSNRIVSDVFAIQLENRSGVDLQYGQINVSADGQEYSFAVTNLRADAVVMLLEQGCSPAPETDQFTAEARDLAWFSEPMSVDAEVLNITGAKGVVNVKNISDQPINGLIHVYYKYIADDCYFGGITFRVKVEGGLQPGEIRQVPSGHFDPESCEVVDVTIYEQ